MKIEEFAEYVGLTLKTQKIGKKKFQAFFEDVEVSDNGLLIGDYGVGKTASEALADYCRRMQGRRLIFKPYTHSERREIAAPGRLEA